MCSGPLQDLSDGLEESEGAAGKTSAEPQSKADIEFSANHILATYNTIKF